jgi:hypothetical protein
LNIRSLFESERSTRPPAWLVPAILGASLVAACGMFFGYPLVSAIAGIVIGAGLIHMRMRQVVHETLNSRDAYTDAQRLELMESAVRAMRALQCPHKK